MGGNQTVDTSTINTKFLDVVYALKSSSVNYSLSSETIFPAAINDANAAIRFIRANAATYIQGLLTAKY